MSTTDVLIVGAGPVGLTAAIELRRRGVECRVVDRLTTPMPYAKAVGVQPRTLELWESAGVLRRALDAATPMRGQIVYVDGRQVARMDLTLPPEVPYGFVALPQYETERVLAERLDELEDSPSQHKEWPPGDCSTPTTPSGGRSARKWRPDHHVSFRAGQARADELASRLALLISPPP